MRAEPDNGIHYQKATVDPSTHAVTFSEETAENYMVVTTSDTSWGTAGQTSWYVVNSSLENTNRITVTGTVNLILCDGATLTAEKGITVNNGNTLNFYAQSGGSGAVTATGNETNAGIGGADQAYSCGTITINGGNVTATGGNFGAGIGGCFNGGGGTITINGGTVKANGGKNGAGIGGGNGGNSGTIEIWGGIIEAIGNSAAGIGGGFQGDGETITIYGGTVTATGGNYGAGIGGGNNDGAGVNAAAGTITIYDGTVTAIGGTRSAGIGGGYKGAGGTVTINGGYVNATGGENAEGIGRGKDNSDSGTLTADSGVHVYASDSSISSVRELSALAKDPDGTVTGSRDRYMKAIAGIYYKDEVQQTITGPIYDYTPVTLSAIGATWNAGTYVVNTDVTINGDVILGADTNLILCDGKTLTVNGGISGSHNFNIYSGNVSGAIAGTGALNATCNSGAYGDVTCAIEIYNGSNSVGIYGGKIRLKSIGIDDGIGILASGNINISGSNTEVYANCFVNNGDVTVLPGAAGRGIKCNGELSITDASVYAMGIGKNGIGRSGIRPSDGITINGGSLTAIGSFNGADGIEGNVTVSGGSPTITATGGSTTDPSSTGGNGIYGNVKVLAGSPTITATGGTNANGISNGVNVNNGATPTILAISGITGENPYAISGKVSVPDTLKVFQGTSASGPWSAIEIVPDNNGVNAQYVKISPASRPTPPTPPTPTHTHSYTATVVSQPDCTHTGTTEYKCSCGSSYTETTPALGHDLYLRTIKKMPTKTKEGKGLYACRRCGFTEERSIPVLTDEDMGNVVTPETKTVSASGTYGGQPVFVSISSTFDSEVTYSGKKFSPKKDLVAKTDLSGLTDLITTNGKYSAKSLFKVTYVSGNNKKAADAGDSKAPYYYIKIKFDEKKAKKAGLSKTEISELKALVKSLNRNLKEQKCYYTIRPVELDQDLTVVKISGKIKKGKIKEVTSVKITAYVNGKRKTFTLSKKSYSIEVLDPKEKTVQITGKGNFDGVKEAVMK